MTPSVNDLPLPRLPTTAMTCSFAVETQTFGVRPGYHLCKGSKPQTVGFRGRQPPARCPPLVDREAALPAT